MEDREIMEERIRSVEQRRKICFLLGWPMIVCGAGLFLSGELRFTAVAVIVAGVFVRILYYFANMELK